METGKKGEDIGLSVELTDLQQALKNVGYRVTTGGNSVILNGLNGKDVLDLNGVIEEFKASHPNQLWYLRGPATDRNGNTISGLEKIVFFDEDITTAE